MYNPQLDTFIRAAEAGSFSKADIIHIGTSPMTPAQALMELWRNFWRP